MSLGGVGGRDDLIASRCWRLGNVVGDRAEEQKRLLEHDADVGSVFSRGYDRMSFPSIGSPHRPRRRSGRPGSRGCFSRHRSLRLGRSFHRVQS